jgi:hypothetical protein
MIKDSALGINGLVKFFPREKSLVKIRNYWYGIVWRL